MAGSKRTTTRIGHLSPQQKTSKKTKKIPPYDRNFVVQQYIKLLQVYYDSNAWKTPVVFVAEMEQ